ncbi:hypothetical protein GCM10011588_23440 [Nocardia jinanensis]|uniref:Uncharacterized protein n=1 Tax=Nocardia jinanensis TaxID=382504 RepID=A0A917VQE4_9NOCA|nr:hypothetical protein GCM10011588_23440 [Nocardia jinanensis]
MRRPCSSSGTNWGGQNRDGQLACVSRPLWTQIIPQADAQIHGPADASQQWSVDMRLSRVHGAQPSMDTLYGAWGVVPHREGLGHSPIHRRWSGERSVWQVFHC